MLTVNDVTWKVSSVPLAFSPHVVPSLTKWWPPWKHSMILCGCCYCDGVVGSMISTLWALSGEVDNSQSSHITQSWSRLTFMDDSWVLFRVFHSLHFSAGLLCHNTIDKQLKLTVIHASDLCIANATLLACLPTFLLLPNLSSTHGNMSSDKTTS